MPKEVLKTLSSGLVIILCLLIIVFLQQEKLKPLTQQVETSKVNAERKEDILAAQLEILKKLPSIGFDNLIADWTYLRFLQYFGDRAARSKTGYTLSPDFFEVIIDRDPRFIEAYSFLSTSVSIYAGKPEKTIELIEKGLQSISPQAEPHAYYWWRFKGIDELLFLGDNKAAQKSFEKAAEWAVLSPDPEGKKAAKSLAQTAKLLAKNPNSKQAQVSAWLMVLNSAPDRPTRQLGIKRIQELDGKVSTNQQGELKVKLPDMD